MQKHYHYDWIQVRDRAARFENLVAMHLLKWVHLEQDVRGRDLDLRYFRDVDGREVDFVVTDREAPGSPDRGEVERPARGQGAAVPARQLPGCGDHPDQRGGNGRLPDSRGHSRAAGDSVPSRPRVGSTPSTQSEVADAAEALDAPQRSGRRPRAPDWCRRRVPPPLADSVRHVTLMRWT